MDVERPKVSYYQQYLFRELLEDLRRGARGEGTSQPLSLEVSQAFTAPTTRDRALALDRDPLWQNGPMGYDSSRSRRIRKYVRWCGRTGAARLPPTRLGKGLASGGRKSPVFRCRTRFGDNQRNSGFTPHSSSVLGVDSFRSLGR